MTGVFHPRGVLVSVNFDCFAPSRFSHFHCKAVRKAIKAHKNWHTIQQNEHTPEFGLKTYYLIRFLPKTACNMKDIRPVGGGGGRASLAPPLRIHQ